MLVQQYGLHGAPAVDCRPFQAHALPLLLAFTTAAWPECCLLATAHLQLDPGTWQQMHQASRATMCTRGLLVRRQPVGAAAGWCAQCWCAWVHPHPSCDPAVTERCYENVHAGATRTVRGPGGGVCVLLCTWLGADLQICFAVRVPQRPDTCQLVHGCAVWCALQLCWLTQACARCKVGGPTFCCVVAGQRPCCVLADHCSWFSGHLQPLCGTVNALSLGLWAVGCAVFRLSAMSRDLKQSPTSHGNSHKKPHSPSRMLANSAVCFVPLSTPCESRTELTTSHTPDCAAQTPARC
jgi:hypothetical protein